MRLGFVDFRREKRDAQKILDQLGIKLDLDVPVTYLSIAQQQMVEIAKALSVDARIIAMDEPSATLTTHELENLFRMIRKLREQGSALFIYHRRERNL